jgi:hypothetical protein
MMTVPPTRCSQVSADRKASVVPTRPMSSPIATKASENPLTNARVRPSRRFTLEAVPPVTNAT